MKIKEKNYFKVKVWLLKKVNSCIFTNSWMRLLIIFWFLIRGRRARVAVDRRNGAEEYEEP